jgi:signal transduction histidine kinase
LAVPPPADKPPRERNVWRDLSLVSRGSRVHFFTGLTLTSVIPPLALCFTLINEGTFRGLFHGPFVPVTVFVLLLMGLGSSMLAKYPANLLRLRRNLETLGRDGPMDLGNPTHGEDDLEAIERNMNRIVTLFQDRIRTIQHQSEALLDAERQRVAIEGLGAACHHMGQPASTMIMALYLTRKAKTPEERESALQLCQQSMDEIREILHKLLHLATYRTEPYLDARPDSTNRNILKI